MSLRSKSLLLLTAATLVLGGALYLITLLVLRPSYLALERQNVETNVGRAQDAVNELLAKLNFNARDWAEWDDTYQYVIDRNSAYAESNLQDPSIARLEHNFAIFQNAAGETAFARGLNQNRDQMVDVPTDELRQLVQTVSAKPLPPDGTTGIVLLDQGSAIIAARQILKSDGTGPSHGTLIFGHYLDQHEIDRLAALTHLTLEIERVDRGDLPTDSRLALTGITPNQPIAVQPLDSVTVAGYATLPDINGQPAILLKISLPRAIYQQGETARRYLTWSLIGAVIVFGILAILLLERLVLRRLRRLQGEVAALGQGSPDARVSSGGNDELSNLTRALNRSLDRIQQTQKDLTTNEERLRTVVTGSPIILFAIDAQGVFTFSEGRGLSVLGLRPGQVVGQSAYEVYRDVPRIGENIKRALAGQELTDEVPVGQFIFETRYSPVRNQLGQVTGLIGVATEITARKRAEDEVRQRTGELERMNQAMVNRELKMVELKQEIAELKQKLVQV